MCKISLWTKEILKEIYVVLLAISIIIGFCFIAVTLRPVLILALIIGTIIYYFSYKK